MTSPVAGPQHTFEFAVRLLLGDLERLQDSQSVERGREPPTVS